MLPCYVQIYFTIKCYLFINSISLKTITFYYISLFLLMNGKVCIGLSCWFDNGWTVPLVLGVVHQVADEGVHEAGLRVGVILILLFLSGCFSSSLLLHFPSRFFSFSPPASFAFCLARFFPVLTIESTT